MSTKEEKKTHFLVEVPEGYGICVSMVWADFTKPELGAPPKAIVSSAIPVGERVEGAGLTILYAEQRGKGWGKKLFVSEE